MDKKTSIWRIYGVTLLLMILSIALGLTTEKTPFKFEKERVIELNSNWQTQRGEVIDLPKILPGKVNEPIAITRQLDERFIYSQVICVRGAMQTIKAYVDDQLVYENLQNSKGFMKPPRVSVWNFISIPEKSVGKTLKLEYTIDIPSLVGHFGPVYVGNESGLKNYIYLEHWQDIMLIFLIFVMGLTFLVAPLIFRETKKTELAYLGLFAIGIAIWFLEQETLLQFITGNVWALGGLGIIILSVFVIPIILFIRAVIVKRTKLIFTLLAYAFTVNAILVTSLQLFGIAQLYETLWLTHGLLAVALVSAAICLSVEIYKDKNPQAKRFLRNLSPFMILALVEIMSFYIVDFHGSPIFVKLGMALFLVLQAIDTIKDFINRVKKSYAAELYQKLAYEDRLTGGANRMAFDQTLEANFESFNKLKHCRLMIFDLNDLKGINDHYGHRTGDDAITIAFKCVERIFSDIGTCYRIGGDEFACIAYHCDDAIYHRYLESLNEGLRQESESLPFNLGLSVGSAVFTPALDRTISDFMHRADLEMYKQKSIKSRSIR